MNEDLSISPEVSMESPNPEVAQEAGEDFLRDKIEEMLVAFSKNFSDQESAKMVAELLKKLANDPDEQASMTAWLAERNKLKLVPKP